MLDILFIILKIIGILLLVLIGLFLLIILLVLFVPIRYRLSLEHGEHFDYEGRVSWLLHIIHLRISQRNQKPHIRIRIFGFIFYDSLRQVVKKKRKKVKQTSNEISTLLKTGNQVKFEEKNLEENEKLSLDKRIENKKKLNSHDKDDDHEKDHEKLSSAHIESRERVDKLGESEDGQGDHHFEDKADSQSFRERASQATEEEVPETFLGKIKFKIISMLHKVKSFFNSLKERLQGWFKSLIKLKQRLSLIKNFIEDEINKEGIRLTASSLFQMLKHILPTKLNSYLVFGTGDPCSTGQILGVLGILYSIYGDNIQIVPDFENQRFEGKHKAKGRIRLVTILIIVIKLMIDKRFKELKTNIKLLKEAL